MVVNKMIVHVLGKTYYAGHCETWPARGNTIKNIADDKRSDVARARARVQDAAFCGTQLVTGAFYLFQRRFFRRSETRIYLRNEDFTLFFRCVSSRIVLIYGCWELAKANAPFSVTIHATALAIHAVSFSLEYETNMVPPRRHHRGNNAENKPDVKERLYCTFNVRYGRRLPSLSRVTARLCIGRAKFRGRRSRLASWRRPLSSIAVFA